MLYGICLGLFLPLLGFLGLLASSSYISRKAVCILACATILISFISFASLLVLYENAAMSPLIISLYDWIPVKGINAEFSLRLDPLSLLMALIITGVGFLIHVYSIGYTEHEEDFVRYFACMNFFVFAMLLLVLSGNLLLLFVGWEGVGLASYLLIGFWYHRPSAAMAATKAFVVNRIGDLGLLIGLLLTFYIFGTSNITEISLRTKQEFSIDAPIIILLTSLYFIGAIGKSAQLPLHVWLPDAMEGPTPVSALIHAATMVTAGVYLVVRLHPMFMMAPTTLHFIGYLGAATSLFAALCALSQTDLKRVLAYSTISQLGLMFLACGVGAFYAAMFHLTTHAFVKALLFLSAGNIVHMLHGTTEMSKMGGLGKIFPKTKWLFLIGVLALSGVPPLSAFFSKDLILEQEHLAGFETLFYVGLGISILTAFYLTRAYCLTFLGNLRIEEHLKGIVKEAPNVMLIPVAVLALLSIVGGLLGFCFFCKHSMLENFLAEVGVILAVEETLDINFFFTRETLMSICGTLLGIGAAAWIYIRFPDRIGKSFQWFKQAFYVNEFYNKVFVAPLVFIASYIVNRVEPNVFDGSISLVSQSANGTARLLQKMQSGQIRSYVAWMIIGSVVLILYLVL